MGAEVEIAETALAITEILKEYLQEQAERIPGVGWDVRAVGEHEIALWPATAGSNILRFLVQHLCRLRIKFVAGEYRLGDMASFRDFHRDRSGCWMHGLRYFEAAIVRKTITRKRVSAACVHRTSHAEQVVEILEFVIASSEKIVQFLEENEKMIGHANVWPEWLADAR